VDDVRVWATTASAAAVYSHAYKPIAVADGRDKYSDETCPALSDDGTTATLTGDCTDADGHAWKGEATVTRDGDDRGLTLTDFDGNRGIVSLHLTSAQQYDFVAMLVIGGVTTIAYSGTAEGDYGARTTWNGSGHFKREGFLSPVGEIEASTEDEVVDNDVCAGQPVSGSTTLTKGDQVAVITYDGESDCDKEANAVLEVNGKDRGLIDGISCSVRGRGRDGTGSSAALALSLLALLGLRRRSGPTTSRAGRSRAALRSRSARCRCTASAAPAPDP
jgi:hypothetical protein